LAQQAVPSRVKLTAAQQRPLVPPARAARQHHRPFAHARALRPSDRSAPRPAHPTWQPPRPPSARRERSRPLAPTAPGPPASPSPRGTHTTPHARSLHPLRPGPARQRPLPRPLTRPRPLPVSLTRRARLAGSSSPRDGPPRSPAKPPGIPFPNRARDPRLLPLTSAATLPAPHPLLVPPAT